MEPTAISDANGLICRGELYRTAFAAAGIPLYDATLYGLDWLSPSENTLRVGKELGLCAENKTAAELVTRAEAAQLLHAVLTQTLTVTPPDMGLTSWRGEQIHRADVEVAKNYLSQPELDALNKIVTAYLDIAEVRALNHEPMYMKDWLETIDDYLKMTRREILITSGHVSNQQALQKAHAEYDKYKKQQDLRLSPVEQSFLDSVEQLERLEDQAH